MKKTLLALGLLLLLSGCDQNQSNTDKTVWESVETVGLNEVCGGSEQIKCGSGLECSEKSPTKTGQCQKMDKKDIECSKDQNPVCGFKNNNKNGYLNPCEAERHGAEILYEGLCKPDKTIANNCEATAISLGNCEAFFMGAEFNPKTGSCQEVGLSGCSADIPFDSVASCQKTCGGKTTSTKLQACPDEKINNLMPAIAPAPSDRSYYIYQGKRYEISDFDAQWVKNNCEVREQNVY